MEARRAATGREGTWRRDAVVYQVYPRSFKDSDGDGIGDLRGIASRLEYLTWLGVDALWISPIHPSPMADSGYDVSAYTGVDPALGTLEDFDRLASECRRLGMRLLMDLVPSHTSIEHPWFREHPDWYVWADRPPNNWRAAFGGSAWSLDEASGRYYLHSFYPEQPDLNWRNPEVRAAFSEIVRFWLARGVDGYRIDALERLMKDPELRDDPPARSEPPLPLHPELAALDTVHSRNDPDIGVALAALREAAGDAVLVGEVYLPSRELPRYLEHLDLAFAFEFLHAPWSAGKLGEVIAAAARLERVAWVLSNHDFHRLGSRLGEEAARSAALLLLTLPGTSFIYQGDEIGMVDGADQGIDRAGRDRFRHPMQWEPEPSGGFSDGDPWLDPTDPERRSVAAQRDDPASLLTLYRDLLALRPTLRGPLDPFAAPDEVLAYRRGEHAVAINLGGDRVPIPVEGEVILSTHQAGAAPGTLAPNAGALIRTV
jgi:alpha-glucosidase